MLDGSLWSSFLIVSVFSMKREARLCAKNEQGGEGYTDIFLLWEKKKKMWNSSVSVWPFATQWTAADQASLSVTNSQSLLKLMSIESVMPSNHLILCHLLLLLPSVFPSIRVFSNESVLHIRWPKYGVSASGSVLPVNIQDRFPLGWTGWISLQSKGLSRVFSNTTVQKHQFFGVQLSL